MSVKDTLVAKIKQIKNSSQDAQSKISQIHKLKPLGLKINTNLDNYLYRNGLFNKATALYDIDFEIKKHQNDKTVTFYQKEKRTVEQSHQKWFENYGIHTGNHDMIKTTIDKWKLDGLLDSLLAELYVGNYTEGSKADMMKY